MNITFNESENFVEIKDKLNYSQPILMVLLSIQFVFRIPVILQKNITDYEFTDYLFLIVGTIFITAIFFQIFKKSTAQKIKLEDINSFNEKPFFFAKRVFLKLDNGRTRDLGIFREDHKDLIQIRDLFDELEIPSNRKS